MTIRFEEKMIVSEVLTGENYFWGVFLRSSNSLIAAFDIQPDAEYYKLKKNYLDLYLRPIKLKV